MQGDPDRQSIAVPFSDDETADKPEDLLEDAPATASPEERLTRKQKQQDRIKRILDDGKKNGELVRELKERDERRERELAELRAQVNRPPPQPQSSGKNPYDEQLDKIYERQGEAYNAAQAEIKAGTWNAERQKHYEKVARDIESEKTRVHIAHGIEMQRMSQRAENAQQIWVNKYPEVYGNQRAYQFAEATFNRRRALLEPGQAVSADLVDEVMAETMATFKLGKRQAPTASEKSRLSGVPSSGGGGGSSRSEGVHMTPELKRMAIAAYSELPEAEAIKKWVNGPGKRMREKKLL